MENKFKSVSRLKKVIYKYFKKANLFYNGTQIAEPIPKFPPPK